ncbi:hypothetical protein [Compostimonas suwonensis]|uniref:Uncharacterized protein n=1 Tax=Compostimonas suwonensis TaxID=1048394 RepID=A0A2M9C4H6_9MICO|nr:hypothetical protein [Compostimonas suwonensis]PJJ65367.1 hypothetical protein CLV54_0399 [Compostimonas suwonensis]
MTDPTLAARAKGFWMDLSRRERVFFVTGASIIVALLALAIAGFSIAAFNNNVAIGNADHAHRAEAELAAARASNDSMRSENSSLRTKVDEANVKEAEFDSRSADLDERAAALDQRDKDVAAREVAVGSAEQQQAANEVRNGVHVVGQGVSAGVYVTDGPSGTNSAGCYYAWKSGTGSDADIVDNNIVDGAATVTLADGDVFESNSCQVWRKVG